MVPAYGWGPERRQIGLGGLSRTGLRRCVRMCARACVCVWVVPGPPLNTCSMM
nr:MAG TPA: hypothetical protein [Caudoviricetes sp.]